MDIAPRLGPDDATRLAPLLAGYAAALLGKPGHAPDPAYAGRLIADPVAEIAGLERDGVLVGFALYYDLPEAISGRRAGQLDDLYVDPAMRGHGGARLMIDHLIAEGRRRGWVHLRWMAPEDSPALALYDRLAEAAPWRNYVVRIDPTIRW